MVTTLYTGRIGYTISLILTEPTGLPISLTSATVTLILKRVGDNLVIWSKACTVDNAANGLAHYTSASGDFDTVGEFYSLVSIAYTGGNARVEDGPKFSVVQNDESVVSISEFIQFLDLPSDTAKSQETCRVYITDAETLVNLAFPGVDTSTVPNFIKLKKTLVKLKAGILYFMNSDENLIDPNKRISKVGMWQKQYNEAVENLNDLMSTDVTSDAGARRVTNENTVSDLFGEDLYGN